MKDLKKTTLLKQNKKIVKKYLEKLKSKVSINEDEEKIRKYCKNKLLKSIDTDPITFGTSLLHGDPHFKNTLFTEKIDENWIKKDEIILFDPALRIGHPYMDIARFITYISGSGEEVDSFCEAYERNTWCKMNQKLLHICLFFQLKGLLCRRKRNGTEKEENMQSYLKEIIERILEKCYIYPT